MARVRPADRSPLEALAWCGACHDLVCSEAGARSYYKRDLLEDSIKRFDESVKLYDTTVATGSLPPLELREDSIQYIAVAFTDPCEGETDADPTAVADDAGPAATDAAAADPAAMQTAALPFLSMDPDLPWRLYAAPFADGEPRPRIAIVFVSLGLIDGATEAIIQQLPGAVTLTFSPYSRKLPDWIARARALIYDYLGDVKLYQDWFARRDESD